MNDSDIWHGDQLGRREEALYLQKYLENVYQIDTKGTASFVLNINSEWGHGKTWFLSRLAKQLKENYPVVYFDAWKNDFTKDALLSFVSIICTELSTQFASDNKILGRLEKVKTAFAMVLKKAVPILTAATAKQLTGVALESSLFNAEGESNEDAIDAASSLANVIAESAIEQFTQTKEGIEKFEHAIEKLVAEIESMPGLHLPIYIFIDELDRCRPTYAIELLESIKHLFSVKGVIFVVATDTKQLSHSIKAVYGNNFDSISYLKRFFYAEYRLASPNYEKMSSFLFEGFNLGNRLFIPESIFKKGGFSGFFSSTARFFQLTARDQEQVFNILQTIVLTSEKNSIHYIFILFLICLKQKFEANLNELSQSPTEAQLSKLLLQMLAAGKLTPVNISAWYTSSRNRREYSVELQKIFDYYLSLLDGDLTKLVFSYDFEGYSYEPEIFQELERSLAISTSGRPAKNHDLNSYFDLMSQAGRLVINV